MTKETKTEPSGEILTKREFEFEGGTTHIYFSEPDKVPNQILGCSAVLFENKRRGVRVTTDLLHVNKPRVDKVTGDRITNLGGDVSYTVIVDCPPTKYSPAFLLELNEVSDGMTASGVTRKVWDDVISENASVLRQIEENAGMSFAWEAGPDVVFQQVSKHYVLSSEIEDLLRPNPVSISDLARAAMLGNEASNSFFEETGIRYPELQLVLPMILDANFFSRSLHRYMVLQPLLDILENHKLGDASHYLANGTYSMSVRLIGSPNYFGNMRYGCTTRTSNADCVAEDDTGKLLRGLYENNQYAFGPSADPPGTPFGDVYFGLADSNYPIDLHIANLLEEYPKDERMQRLIHGLTISKPGTAYGVFSFQSEDPTPATHNHIFIPNILTYRNYGISAATDGIRGTRNYKRKLYKQYEYAQRIFELIKNGPISLYHQIVPDDIAANPNINSAPDDIVVKHNNIELI